MTKIISLYSENKSKYITFERNDEFISSFQEFLKEIGIIRDRRKNLYKDYEVCVKGGRNKGDFTDTLQAITNDDKTIVVEVFTGQDVIIVAIQFEDENVGILIGEKLSEFFDLKKKTES